MRKLALFLLVTSFFGTAPAAASDAAAASETIPVAPGKAKPEGITVLVFVARRMYREEPLEGLRSKFDKHGIGLKVASRDTAIAVGMNRTVIRPDLRLRDADPAEFDMLVLNGGSGAALYWDDTVVHAKVREFAQAGRPLAAIDIAPVILAKAGVLKDRRATVYPHRAAVTWLKENGALYSFNPVVTDDGIITASDTEQTKRFVDAILDRLGVRD
ncbi:MAG: DJ-1/PfpI family protein [candidate division WOR-3 bacterium]|nr:MAG: DJ-1/PfpI family protein [candidate division WOR-3 bacterium]